MKGFRIGLVLFGGFVAGFIVASRQTDKQRFTDFACGYRYGTRDAVVLASPIIGVRPEFQPKPWCIEVEKLAYKFDFQRVAPRD